MNHNQLTPAETERLAWLTEELGEVLQVIGKITRHGYESRWPKEGGASNREELEKELGHVEAALLLMTEHRDFEDDAIRASARAKLDKVGQWLHHNVI